ncbi:MAG: hypothetical protein FJ102_17555, partial [Deltaproteobacteria bacterium]|nr:hypothetical protein [Deltaproteobacteria bacterium]
DGLEELRTRVQGAHPDRDRAMAAVGGLDHGRWVNPLDAATDAARGLKKLAAVLSGAGGGLPATAEVGAFDDAATIREKHAPLFRAASTDRTLGAAQDDHVKTQLQGLDKVEAELVRDVHHRLRELFDKKLRQAALRSLPDVENGLRAVAALLDDHAQRNSARLGESRPPPDPYREELEAAVRALPDAALMRASGLVVGAAVAFPVFMLVGGADPQAAAPAMPTIAATSAASAAPAAVPFPVAELVPFGVALALGVVAFLAWYWIASHFAREGVRRVLTQRLMAVRELWAGGGGGRNERQAEDQLDLRRQRVRRVARLAIGHALNHISSFKLGINRALDRAGQHLRAMSVEPTSSPATDDLRRLWGEGDHLHQPLVSPRRVAEWVSRARVKAGAPEWADALLERSWPRRDDDAHDEPCADQALLVAAAQAQVAAIEVAPASGAGSVTSLLSDGGVRDEAAAQVARFVQHAVAALDQPMLPLRDDGTPAGQAAMAPLAIAPRVALDRFEEAYKHSQLTVTPLWVDSPAPRVVFVRAWDGYTAEEVARGAGLAPGGRPA